MGKDASRHWWWLHRPASIGLLLFLLAALPRLGYGLLYQSYEANVFEGEMERAAFSLATKGDIADVFGHSSGPSAHVAPLYAYLLSFVYRIFGLRDACGWRAQVILTVMVTSLSIALLPWLGRRLRLHPAAGYLAAILAALSPANLWVETSGSWEQSLASLCLLGLLVSVVVFHDRRWKPSLLVCGTGLLVGAAALLSPSLLPAVAVMLASELWLQRDIRPRVAMRIGVISLVAAACMAPWVVRNYVRLGGFVPIRSNFGLELFIGNNPQANGTFVTNASDPECVSRPWHPYGSRTEVARIRDLGELTYMREKQRRALTWITENPERFAALTARRCLLFWFPPVDLWSPETPARHLKMWTFSLTTLATLLCLLWTFASRHHYRWLVLAAVVGPCLVYLVTHVDPRYRYPTFQLTVLLGCQSLCLLLDAARSRLSERDRPLTVFSKSSRMPDAGRPLSLS